MTEITKKVTVKKTILELMTDLMYTLDARENDIKQEYYDTCELEEYTDWKTGEIKERNKWDYRDKEILSETDKLKLEAIDTIRKALEKLI